MKKLLDPWSSESVRDYDKLVTDFGMERFRPLLKKMPAPHLFMKRGIIFGHRDFGRILDAVKKKNKFVMLTGLMPSGKFHLGHMMVAEQIIYYQKLGATVFVCAADIEAFNMRGITLEKGRKAAIEEYLLNYIALGLKPKNCDFYFQSNRSADSQKSNAYYRLIQQAAKKTTHSELKAVYGEVSPAKIMSVLTQVSDILHPQLKEFGGKKPVIVPVGADQDPHIKLTRDITARFNKMKGFDFIPPSSTYHEYLKGLKGGKMSSSDPLSYIALTDPPETVKTKIMKYAFSGGQATTADHRKKGGNPDVDVSYQMLFFMFEEDDQKIKKIRDAYASGALLTGELKYMLIEKLITFLEKHQEKREKAKDMVTDFLK